jgi:hypothetical protein
VDIGKRVHGGHGIVDASGRRQHYIGEGLLFMRFLVP